MVERIVLALHCCRLLLLALLLAAAECTGESVHTHTHTSTHMMLLLGCAREDCASTALLPTAAASTAADCC